MNDGRVRRRRSSISSRRSRGRGAVRNTGEADAAAENDGVDPVEEEAEEMAAEEEILGEAAEPASSDVAAEEGAAAGDDEFTDESPGREPRESGAEPRGRRSRGRRRRSSRGRGSHGDRAAASEAARVATGGAAESVAEGERPSDERGGHRQRRSMHDRFSRRREPGASRDGGALREDRTAPAAESAPGDVVELPTWVEPVGEGPDLFKRTRRQRRDLMTAGGGESATADDDEPEAAGNAKGKSGRRGGFKRILINADDPEEVRIAVVEDGRLEELYYDRPGEKRYLGNIYRGRVVNLEPAIQAAFVDIGIGRNGFLHVSDVLPAYKDSETIPIDSLSQRLADRRRLRIQEILRDGQEVLVQISKDAIGAKGPSLTTYVSVPGKFLVLMPGVSRHGVSKRIQDDEDRHDLRKELANLNPPKGMGYIVRTAGHGCTREEFDKDFRYLMKVWEELTARVKKKYGPSLCYAESDLVIRTMRDLFGPDVDEILVDDPAVFERARDFCREVMTEENPRLKLYSGATPIFTRFGVEEEIEKIYNRKVPLPSGGHIVVEQTEALVAIDVNSGKYRDEEDLEATALKTNLEAAEVIARELRLRDFGGIIINDFIDMERESNRREVERAFRRALKGERAKCWVSRISRFGIIEMTRQRVRPSFERDHYEPCRCCRGTGVIKTARSTGMAILRQARAGLAMKRKKTCEIAAHPEVVDYLLNDRRSYLMQLEEKYRKTVNVVTNSEFSLDQFVVRYV